MKKTRIDLGALLKKHWSDALLLVVLALGLIMADEELLLLLAVMAALLLAGYVLTRPLAKWLGARTQQKRQEKELPPPKPKQPTLRPLFTAAGKGYAVEAQLMTRRTKTERVFIDWHGRTVLCLRERFPCFDSYDYLYEDRYFRWYFILHDGALTLVRTQDDRSEYRVYEKITREEWENCALDSFNRNVFAELGFEQYLR